MNVILIALGANLNGPHGTPIKTLQKCGDFFEEEQIYIQKSSNIWKSAPVPISDQPWYHNAVCAVKTAQSPHEILKILNKIEYENGRTRHTLNEARSLDLDLIAYNTEIIETKNLHIPHPRMHQRAFVLMPLQEIAPKWVHPVLKQTVSNMIKKMPNGQDIERVDDTALMAHKEHLHQ